MAQQVQKLEGDEITSAANLNADGRPMTPLDAIKSAIVKQKGEFLKALPSHISFEKFQRTVMTAVIQNPDLITANRQSLLLSCIKAATDGLMPDGRDAALVIFNSKGKDAAGKDVWMKKVQYLPMYAGILKKVRQSQEISSIVSHVVYLRDKFEYVLGDDERIVHEPYMGVEARGAIIAAYCIAKLKDGSIVREVMTFQDIEKVRRTSKSGAMSENDLKYNQGAKIGDPKGIWRDWYEEMARKTVFRRAAKWLPQAIEIIDTAFKNDASMEVIDSFAETAPVERITADGEVLGITDGTADEGAQPDLKEKIKEKQAAQPKAQKKQKAEAKKEEEGDRPSNEEEKPDMAEKNEENQDGDQNVKRETTQPQPKTTIEEIIDACKAARDSAELYEVWENWGADIGAIKRNNPGGYKEIMAAKNEAEKRIAGTEA